MHFIDERSKIYVAGHRGMVGAAVVRALHRQGFSGTVVRRHAELDLLDQRAVNDFFQEENVDCVILAAARVGGILANNTYPAEFIYQNLTIQNNVIHAAWENGVENLLFLGSSCIYPKFAPQPMKEEYLLTGSLEPTNEPYAVAKIAGIKMCEAYNRQYGTRYFALMPTNLYGPGDRYDLENSHVLPALIRKMHEAKTAARDRVVVWGTGKPRREFLHCDDLADAVVFLLTRNRGHLFATFGESGTPLINVGCGKDISIRELAELIRQAAGFSGSLEFDVGKPDGTPRKLLDVTRLHDLGWQASIPLDEGIRSTWLNYVNEVAV